MKLDKFIKRPVLSTVISIFIVLLGLIGLISMPITQYPDLAPPTISVTTNYTGASAQTVLNSVIVPLEEAINGAQGMTYMESTASNSGGSAEIVVTFEQGFNPDMAAVDVQNRVSKALGLLPAEVTKVGVLTQKRQTSMLIGISLYADNGDEFDEAFLDNYMKINMVPNLQRIPGVGDVKPFGADYSMRIWIKPEVLAQYGMDYNEVLAALDSQNLEAAPGAFGEQGNQSFQYIMRTKGRLETPEQFENIVVRANANGEVLRLKDVATIEMGRMMYTFHNKINKKVSTLAMVYQTPGSNATEIINQCEDYVKSIENQLPPGIHTAIILNNNDFLYAAIGEVVKTLIEAFILVFLVVYIFLQDIRSTVIPAIAIPVALIGTFFAMNIIGFSLNLITLSALVLAIAIVVDDAIVVVEAVHAKLDEGYHSARKASIDAMADISGALISITMVMMLVFVPVSFMTGTSGVFYRQFGLTMAISIGFSALNALTLSPALCALLLKAHGDKRPTSELVGEAVKEAASTMGETTKKRFNFNIHPGITLIFLIIAIAFLVFGWYTSGNVVKATIAFACAAVALLGLFGKRFHEAFEAGFSKLLSKYNGWTKFFANNKTLSMGFVIGAIAALGWLMSVLPSTLVPTEDQGMLFVMVDMPPGTSQERTQAAMEAVDDAIQDIPGIKYRQMINGFSFVSGDGSCYGSFIIKLKHWEERHEGESAEDIQMAIMQKASVVKDARVMALMPPMIIGYSATDGIELKMQDRTGGDINKFAQVVEEYLQKVNAQPEIQLAYSSFDPNCPQYMVEVNAEKALQAGLNPKDILSTMQAYYGGMYVSNFNRFGKMYRVMLQAPAESRVSPETLGNVKIPNKGKMASLSNFVTLKRCYGPDLMKRFNLFMSISVTAMPSPGKSSGEAIAAIKRVADESLPTGYGYEFSGMTREEAGKSSSTLPMIFGLCLLFVYLLLSAQYESYILPFAVILSIPLGLMGTMLFALFQGLQNSIYLQIALIMLIGLLAKNAILIVEFAAERRRGGMTIVEAAIDGATARLRPILMTSLALIIGLMPMMFAHGVGANGNRALGSGSIGGMLIGMVLQVLIVPALFVIFQSLQEKISPNKDDDDEAAETAVAEN